MKPNLKEMQIEQLAGHPGNTGADLKIMVRYRGLNARAVWQALVERELRKLQNLAAIASARVTLEWNHEVRPAFRVAALLEVPGPDFHAEASDHTLRAALLKVTKNLERQIQSRKKRRADNPKTSLQLGLSPGRL